MPHPAKKLSTHFSVSLVKLVAFFCSERVLAGPDELKGETYTNSIAA